ncbi:MAG: hypothetical protein K6T87_18865 [Roseiflexus sp.]|uniref:hypothetical protein n=1 Tax=Roseiflexus sp. TaxID=2562120 RepID=UPI0025F18DE1|nr:hypothetical protein [Roseiflexus sp.]MCL6542621.1 hypothetical protein [Roseiflexus sp.]
MQRHRTPAKRAERGGRLQRRAAVRAVARLIVLRSVRLRGSLNVLVDRSRRWAECLIQRAGVMRRCVRRWLRQRLERAPRDFVVRVDRQRAFQAFTPPFGSFDERRHPQPGDFVMRINAQRLHEKLLTACFVAGANSSDSIGDQAVNIGRDRVRH